MTDNREGVMLVLRDEHNELTPIDDIVCAWAKEAILYALADDISWTCDGSPASIARETRPDFICEHEWGMIVESAIEGLEKSGAIKRLPYEDEDFYVLPEQYDDAVAVIEKDDAELHSKPHGDSL